MAKKTKNKGNSVNPIFYSSFMALIVGIIFAVAFFLGERYGFLPTITLGSLSFGESGDPTILFVIAFMASIFIGSIIVFYILKKRS